MGAQLLPLLAGNGHLLKHKNSPPLCELCNKGTIGSDLVLDGRHEYEQIQGVLPVPAPVKQLLADAHSTASQLQIFLTHFPNICQTPL